MSLVQKFEEAGFVFYNIKGVVGPKRRLTADQTVHLRKQFKEDQGSQFLKFSRLPQQLDIGMEQHKILRHYFKKNSYKIHIFQTLSNHKKIIR